MQGTTSPPTKTSTVRRSSAAIKNKKVCENKRNLRISIEECPTLLSSRIEFGPWKADTHGGVKGGTFLSLLRFSSG